MRRIRPIALCLAVVALAAALSGCGAGVAALLKIAGASALLPDRWTSHGGLVRIVADIISGNSLERVIARIKHEGTSAITEVVLTRNAEGKYEGTFQAPENTSQAAPEEYTAVVEATDAAGNTATSEPVTVEVPPETPTAAQ